MSKKLEAHMIAPIRLLMSGEMGLNVIAEEFSAGYGRADLVGAAICKQNWRRRSVGIESPLDYEPLLEVLLLLTSGTRHSLRFLLNRVSFSENILMKKVLPQMETMGIITIDYHGYVRLLKLPPQTTKNIVAVEAKQTKWQEAILQARRYTFFADQTFIAVWNGTASRVDRRFLYRHRIGLIGVEGDCAEIILNAPKRNPRQPKMHRYCSEFLYRKALDEIGSASI